MSRPPPSPCLRAQEIYVNKDTIHILKHHGSYMQQNRDLKKKAEREKSYQFMLRLKVPCGEVPAALFRELDDLSNKYGQGDLRATTRQAFQLHGVLKGDLKKVISTIANVGKRHAGPPVPHAALLRRARASARTHAYPPTLAGAQQDTPCVAAIAKRCVWAFRRHGLRARCVRLPLFFHSQAQLCWSTWAITQGSLAASQI
eukprot:6173654-Pleurochrysis_carterae.AAC.5